MNTSVNFKKVWHPYTKWECFRYGMWRTVSGKKRLVLLKKAIEFTGNAELYGSFMLVIIEKWPITCEHHLTEIGSNRKAFVGHAAAQFAIKSPEDITRQAWGHLSLEQQDEANYKADQAIAIWEKKYNERQNRTIYQQMDEARLQKRYPRRSRPKARITEQGAFLSFDLPSSNEE